MRMGMMSFCYCPLGLGGVETCGPRLPQPHGAAGAPDVAAERQFDFWLGEWDLVSRQRVRASQEEWIEGCAFSRVRAILDGKIIQEHFDGSQLPHPHSSTRMTAYSRALGRWQQTWTDDRCGNIDFCGGLRAGEMVLTHETTKDGKALAQRIVFSSITRHGFEWRLDASRDRGQTWRLLWHVTYRRRR